MACLDPVAVAGHDADAALAVAHEDRVEGVPPVLPGEKVLFEVIRAVKDVVADLARVHGLERREPGRDAAVPQPVLVAVEIGPVVGALVQGPARLAVVAFHFSHTA